MNYIYKDNNLKSHNPILTYENNNKLKIGFGIVFDNDFNLLKNKGGFEIYEIENFKTVSINYNYCNQSKNLNIENLIDMNFYDLNIKNYTNFNNTDKNVNTIHEIKRKFYC